MPVCRPRFSSGFGRKRTVGSRGEKKHRLLLLIVVATPMSKAAAFFSLSLSLSISVSPRKRALVGSKRLMNGVQYKRVQCSSPVSMP